MLNGQWPTAVQRGDPARARRKPNSVPANCCLAIPLFSFIIHPLAFIIRSVSVKKSGVTLDGTAEQPYDALLVVSFGGPERREDVIPFLENVVRGKNVPRERMLSVAEHYYQCGGHSPINDQNRALIGALKAEFERFGPPLPIYWGNRNWHPLLPDALRQMAADGVRRALAFFTSAYSSYSGCRQYRENIAAAQAEVGPRVPQVERLRAFFNHPLFIELMVGRVGEALANIPQDRRVAAQVIFTAHSIPLAMAPTASTRRNCARPASSSPRRIQTTCGDWRIKAVAGRRASRGSCPMSATRFATWLAQARRCRRRTHRFPFRPPGNPLRSRCRSQETGRRCRAQHGARRHGRRRPDVCGDDSRACARAPRHDARTAGIGRA